MKDNHNNNEKILRNIVGVRHKTDDKPKIRGRL